MRLHHKNRYCKQMPSLTSEYDFILLGFISIIYKMNAYRECRGTRSCYCWSCQADRLSVYASKQPGVLLNELEDAKQRENEALEKTFEEVLNQVAISKAFRLQIYNLFRYKNTASFFKAILGYNKEDAKKNADKINRACKIYDHFNTILINLQLCPHIDIRKLSVNQLHMAFHSKWCVMHNEVLREQTRARGDDFDTGYDEEDFSNFLEVVKSHPVYQSIDKSRTNNYGQREIAALLHRTQKALRS